MQLSFKDSPWRNDEIKEITDILDLKHDPQPVLKGASLQLEKGKITALLGRNGAGKTTITKLLMHYYEPTKGRVLLNGVPLPEVDPHWLHRQFGVLQQEPVVLNRFSVRENLLLGAPEGTNEKAVWKVLERVGLKQVVAAQPKGLDAVVGEDTNFSGGQKQLLALARVLLQRRPFVILDEGSSQLDVEKEAEVLKILREVAQDSAVLFITHRVTTARRADHLYILDDGKVVEEGTHSELLAAEGLYSQFWKTQVVE